MSKLTDPQALVMAAVIGVIGIVVGAVATPLAQKWVNSPATPDTPQSLEIEQIPQNIVSYAGNSAEGNWSGFLLIYDNSTTPVYELNYVLPVDKAGFAGLVFQFAESQNLSEYHAIQFELVFGQPNDEIDFFVRDISNNVSRVHVVANSQSEMILRYEYSNFNNANFNAIKEVGLDATTDFISGNHMVRIKNILFVK
jgi:hypothetical protein